MHRDIEPSILYFGTPVALIATENEDGSINVAPNSSMFWLGWSCMIGIDASSQTAENLRRNGSCVINLPSFDMADQVNAVAMYTGSNPVPLHKYLLGYKYKKDKLEGSGLTTVAAKNARGARIEQCPIQLEAEVKCIHSFGDSDSRLSISALTIELSVVKIYASESVLAVGTKDKIDPLRWNPLIMSFRRFFGLSDVEARSALHTGDEDLYAPWKMSGVPGIITRLALRLSKGKTERKYC